MHRNELYNAHGAMMDEPRQLDFVCPDSCGPDWGGALFAELEVDDLKIYCIDIFSLKHQSDLHTNLPARPGLVTRVCATTPSGPILFSRAQWRRCGRRPAPPRT